MDDRKLLLTDLSARFPYNVALNCKDKYDDKVNFTRYLTSDSDILSQLFYDDCMWTYQPYLYPLSSMTEEQNLEYLHTCKGGNASVPTLASFDWFNKNHFDYRGLIEQGLAIDATNLNIY